MTLCCICLLSVLYDRSAWGKLLDHRFQDEGFSDRLSYDSFVNTLEDICFPLQLEDPLNDSKKNSSDWKNSSISNQYLQRLSSLCLNDRTKLADAATMPEQYVKWDLLYPVKYLNHEYCTKYLKSKNITLPMDINFTTPRYVLNIPERVASSVSILWIMYWNLIVCMCVLLWNYSQKIALWIQCRRNLEQCHCCLTLVSRFIHK